MSGCDLAVPVLDQVEVLDQEIAAPRSLAEQQRDFMRSGRIDLAALRRRLRSFPPRTRVVELADFLYVVDHRRPTLSNFIQF